MSLWAGIFRLFDGTVCLHLQDQTVLLGPRGVGNTHLRNNGKYLPVQTVPKFSIFNNNTAGRTSNFALVRSQLQFQLSNLNICTSNHDFYRFFFQLLHFRVISGFHRGVDEICAFFGNLCSGEL
jgi:hypothetical protein